MPDPSDAHVIHIPVDDVEREPVTGNPVIRLGGDLRRVAWHADLGCWLIVTGNPCACTLGDPVWRTGTGCWHTGSAEEFMVAPVLPSRAITFTLPPVPPVAEDASPVPAVIHFVWIGDHGIPADLLANIARNVSRSPGFACTVHGHADTAGGRALLQQQVISAGARFNDLTNDPAFARFMASGLGACYRQFIPEASRNLGAASDLLRVVLLYEHGGVYLDCDDCIESTWPAPDQLLAGAQDILLNKMVRVPHLGFRGYNSSNFACHPGNPVLAALLKEMQLRLEGASAFLASPRPWREATVADDLESVQQMEIYKLRILHLTGPVVLNDVLSGLRPDYYPIEALMLHAYQQLNPHPGDPCVLADDYFERMHAVKRHYLPFADGPFAVTVGNADSWNRRSIACP
jgi:hypothetical protein